MTKNIISINNIINNYLNKFDSEIITKYKISSNKWKSFNRDIDLTNIIVEHIILNNDIIKEDNNEYILNDSVFKNNSIIKQDYLMKFKRNINTNYEIELNKGYITGISSSLGLTIPIPAVIFNINTGLKKEYTINQHIKNTFSDKLNWTIESSISIPPTSQINIQINVNENTHYGRFKIKTYFKGYLILKINKNERNKNIFNNMKDKISSKLNKYIQDKDILEMELHDLEKIFDEKNGFSKDDNGIYIISEGNFKINHNLKHSIIINQNLLH